MELGWTIIIWLISLFALFIVIRAAINGSDLAYDVRLIRKKLEEHLSNDVDEDEDEDDEDDEEADNPIYSECPACGAKLAGTDKECPECGLTIK